MDAQDLQLYLMINGTFPYFNNTNNVQPAYILPKTELTDTYAGTGGDDFYAHTVAIVNDINYAFVSSHDAGLMVFTLADQPRGMNYTEPHNATHVASIAFDSISSGNNTVCTTLEKVGYNDKGAGLLLSCSFLVSEEVETRWETVTHNYQANSLFLVFYDIATKSLELLAESPLEFLTTQMVVRPKAKLNAYEILLIYDSVPNNNLSRLEMITDLVTGSIQYAEIINYSSLGLTHLVIKSFDCIFNLTSNTLVTYVAEATAGLLVLETPMRTNVTTVVSTAMIGNDTVALSICSEPGLLEVANLYGDIFEYDISSRLNPVHTSTYPRHSNVNNTYTATGPNIECSGGSDPQFLALTVSSDAYVTRIIDRHARWQSNVFVDIPISLNTA